MAGTLGEERRRSVVKCWRSEGTEMGSWGYKGTDGGTGIKEEINKKRMSAMRETVKEVLTGQVRGWG